MPDRNEIERMRDITDEELADWAATVKKGNERIATLERERGELIAALRGAEMCRPGWHAEVRALLARMEEK
jgi:hypothetical protein